MLVAFVGVTAHLRHGPISFFLFLLSFGSAVAAQPQQSQLPPLKQLSIEQLLELDVLLPLRRDDALRDAPAAISVLTSEDMRRQGAVSLPEALRFVPGLFVARFSGLAWVIASRGFASTTTNKLLAMIDGRSVYSPMFPGVFWEHHDPLSRGTNLLTAFLQDEVQLSRTVTAVAGTEVERNDYTGVEWQPSARIRWKPAPEHMIWGAVSRAVRMPTRFDTDLRVILGNRLVLSGSSDFESERLVAYAAGFRSSPRRFFSLDISVFRNHYDNLRTQELRNASHTTCRWTPTAETSGSRCSRPWIRSTRGKSCCVSTCHNGSNWT